MLFQLSKNIYGVCDDNIAIMIIVLFPGHTQRFIVLEQRAKWPVLPACFARHSDEPPVVRSFRYCKVRLI